MVHEMNLDRFVIACVDDCVTVIKMAVAVVATVTMRVIWRVPTVILDMTGEGSHHSHRARSSSGSGACDCVCLMDISDVPTFPM